MQLPESFNNKITKTGITLSVISFIVIIALLVFPGDVEEWSVAGILTYVVLTVVWLVGIILIPVGMGKFEKKNTPEKKSSVWNLTDRGYRNAFYVFLGGLLVFALVSTAGAYKSYHYMESVKFCGTTCHTLMEPEYTAHAKMEHANLRCVDCHIGEGVSGFLASKVEASRELISMMAGTVPHPIHAHEGIHEVAKEACQHCHWSQKFQPDRKIHRVHFLRDEENTEYDIDMTLHLASGNKPLGLSKGAHWHMNKDVKIEYVATDKEAQEIPWVKLTDLKTGKSTVFQNEDEPLDKEAFDTLKVVQMTCIDCHSRPAHDFKPAEEFINAAFVRGEIDRSLPEFKAAAVAAVSEEEFTSSDSAKILIPQKIKEFYDENYPEVLEENKEALDKSIAAVVKGFSQNVFPDMKVRWDKYYNNIGHLKSKGCFRCHDGMHVAENDEVIPKTCTTCHTFNAIGTPGEMVYATPDSPLDFIHPGEDVEQEDWEEALCSDCHAGTGP
jgi:nitrate/TMAO reductase-like tetraheme cytochrome c subunit